MKKCVFVVPNDLNFGKTRDLKSPELNYLVEIKPYLFPSLSKTRASRVVAFFSSFCTKLSFTFDFTPLYFKRGTAYVNVLNCNS